MPSNTNGCRYMVPITGSIEGQGCRKLSPTTRYRSGTRVSRVSAVLHSEGSSTPYHPPLRYGSPHSYKSGSSHNQSPSHEKGEPLSSLPHWNPRSGRGVSPLRMADPASPSGACGATCSRSRRRRQPVGPRPDTSIPPAALHSRLPLLLGSAPPLAVQAASSSLTGSARLCGCFVDETRTPRLDSIPAPCVSASAPGANSTRLLGVSRYHGPRTHGRAGLA